MAGWQEFAGLNRGYVLELYEKYRNDPASVDAETRAVFERWTPPAESAAVPDGLAYEKIVGAARLAQSIRRYGHLAATLALASRTYIINNGHSVHEAATSDIRAHPEVLQRYLGV